LVSFANASTLHFANLQQKMDGCIAEKNVVLEDFPGSLECEMEEEEEEA
jgi:hypothetical protein